MLWCCCVDDVDCGAADNRNDTAFPRRNASAPSLRDFPCRRTRTCHGPAGTGVLQVAGGLLSPCLNIPCSGSVAYQYGVTCAPPGAPARLVFPVGGWQARHTSITQKTCVCHPHLSCANERCTVVCAIVIISDCVAIAGYWLISWLSWRCICAH